MRKKGIIVLGLILFCLTDIVQGQNSVISHLWKPEWYTKCVNVRCRQGRSAVSGFVSNGYNATCFSYQSNLVSGFTTIRYVPGVEVYDFVISNDTVFFCGSNIERDLAVIGFFDIEKFFFGNDSALVYSEFYVDSSGVARRLDRIVTYYDQLNVRHIVAVGEARDLLRGSTNGCVVDLYANVYGIINNYQIGTFPITDNETVCDVALVGNHVVTAGFLNGANLCLRVYEKYNLFVSVGIQDTRFLFRSITEDWRCDNILLTDLNASSFATAAIMDMGDNVVSDSVINITEYDITPLLSANSNCITISKDITPDNCVTVNNLYQYEPIRKRERMGLLFNAKLDGSSNPTNSVFLEFDYAVSSVLSGFEASTSEEYCLDRNLQGMDTYNNMTGYVFSGYCDHPVQSNRKYYLQSETSSQASLCSPRIVARIKDSGYIRNWSQYCAIKSKRNLIEGKHYKLNAPIKGIIVDCIDGSREE